MDATLELRHKLTNGIFLESAILNDECANPVIDYQPRSVFVSYTPENAYAPRPCYTYS